METPPGFNLDAAVAAWRAELARQPGLTLADLRELEAHLRDGFAELRKLGLHDDEAFLVARHRVGPPRPVADEYVKAASRRFWSWRVFGATFVAVFIVFAAYAFFATPEYVAWANIQWARPRTAATPPLTVAEYYHQIGLLERPENAQRVAEMLSPDERQAFLSPFPGANPTDSTTDDLVGRLLLQRTVSPGRFAYLIQVGVEHPDPHLAAVVANDFARTFVQTGNASPQSGANGESFRLIGDATNSVIQSEPKVLLLLTSGFFFGLLLASAAAALVCLVGHIRFQPPSVKLAS